MIRQIGKRIIRRTQNADLQAAQQFERPPRRFGQTVIGLLQIIGARNRVQRLVDVEIALQFKMGPVIERIADQIRHERGPGQKLFLGVAGSGDQALRDPA